MFTARGWWLLFGVGFITFHGVIWMGFYQPTVTILGLTLLLWVLFEWCLFQFRRNLATFQIERTLLIAGREVPALWAGVSATIRLRIRNVGRCRLPFIAALDKAPPGYVQESGTRKANFSLAPGEYVDVEYVMKPDNPGVLRFEGVELRMADLCGLFYERQFLRQPVDYLILPPLVDDEGQQRATKRFNTLPPPGVHRMRRPGGGNELLDLRDYRPGDPPKMIAWKASARRDRLITKEFESDVPVRCMIFLDASNSTRLGDPARTMLSRLAAIGASVSQAASAGRDIVGLCVFDEKNASITKPARTRVHTMQLLRIYAETAGRQLEVPSNDVKTIQSMAHSLAQDQYPDLLDKRWNTRPWGLYWLPLLDTKKGWLLAIPIGIQYLMFDREYVQDVIQHCRDMSAGLRSWEALIALLILFWIFFFIPMHVMFFLWFLHGIRGFFNPIKKQLMVRKQLGALYTTLDNDTPSAIERYIYDDEFFLNRSAKFLADHHLQPPAVLFDEHGNYNFKCEAKIPILADAMMRSIGVAQDNELYVILADLVELDSELDPLLRMIRMARARHHQVVVILLWPEDMPEPGADEKDEKKPKKQERALTLSKLVSTVVYDGYKRKYETARTALIRAGASVLRSNADDPVRLILDKLEQLRHARIRK